ncbi:MAG: Ig-like domain-containing protein, partial [Anaerolineae bacterium]|nr:Ig-like domain-containing protein [Anaerolineae bacterium]
VNNVPATVDQVVPVAFINAGNFRFLPDPNENGNNYATFTFQVQDNGGTANGGADLDPVARTMTIHVTPVNDAPTGANNTVVTLEDTAYVFAVADFGFADSNDVPPNSFAAVRITALPAPASGTLTNNNVPVQAGDSISVASVLGGQLRFTPAPNANGAALARFPFQVQDNGGRANGGQDTDPVPKSMTINVTPVNDAPVGTGRTFAIQTGTQRTLGIADFGFSDPSDSPQNNLLAVRITTAPTVGSLTLSGTPVASGTFVSATDIAAGRLVYNAPATVPPSTATFTFQVQDDGGTANGGVDLDPIPKVMTFSITTAPIVNRAPSGTDATVTTAEDVPYVFALSDFPITDPLDSPPHALGGLVITSLPTRGSLTLSGVPVALGQTVPAVDIAGGNLRFTPAANQSGSPFDTFTFRVRDNGGTANGGVDLAALANTITVNVLPVNDPPAGQDRTITTLEDTPYTFVLSDFGYSDPNDTPPNNFIAVRITTLPTAGTLRLGASNVAAGDLIP